METKILCKILESIPDEYSVNNFVYSLYKVECGNLKDFVCLVPVFKTLRAGDCILVEKFSIVGPIKTDKGLCNRPCYGLLREITVIDESEYKPMLNVIFSTRLKFRLGARSTLQGVGTTKKPFIRFSIEPYNPFEQRFNMLGVAFNKTAERISTETGNISCEAEVCLKNLKSGDGYECCINDYIKQEASIC